MADPPMPGRRIAVFVLRQVGVQTEVLLVERSASSAVDAWCPVAASARPGEADVEAALRELGAETALQPVRLYAAPFSEWIEEEGAAPGVLTVFVVYAAADAELPPGPQRRAGSWLSFAEADARLPLAGQRRLLERVREAFVRRPADEALRIALSPGPAA